MLLPLSSGDTTTGEMPQDGTPLPAFGNDGEPSLFDISEPAPATKPQSRQKAQASPSELQILEAISELKALNSVDRQPRKIKEIRVFYDDGTYESFGPNK